MDGTRSSRRIWLTLFWLTLCVCVLSAIACDRRPSENALPTPADRLKPALVSLSPGITETIVELGAREQLVGISDYCELDLDPRSAQSSPARVGSALTPNYEAIARLRPDLILASEVAGNQLKPLTQLAKTVSLPWLDLSQVTSSIKQLSQLIGKETEGARLVTRLETALSAQPNPTAQRVLWVLDLGDSAQNETWFIRANSLHGAALRAAGARNAVPDAISGQAKLSAEQLLKLDPDVILIVLTAQDMSAQDLNAAKARAHRHFSRFSPLKAVKNDHIVVLHHAGAMNIGPGVLRLIPALSHALAQVQLP